MQAWRLVDAGGGDGGMGLIPDPDVLEPGPWPDEGDRVVFAERAEELERAIVWAQGLMKQQEWTDAYRTLADALDTENDSR